MKAFDPQAKVIVDTLDTECSQTEGVELHVYTSNSPADTETCLCGKYFREAAERIITEGA